MAKLTFDFSLPEGTRFDVVLVSGGLDVNGDGRIDERTEMLPFMRGDGMSWKAEVNVPGSTKGMYFALNFTIGANVEWKLRVTGDNNAEILDLTQKTMFASDVLRGRLPR